MSLTSSEPLASGQQVPAAGPVDSSASKTANSNHDGDTVTTTETTTTTPQEKKKDKKRRLFGFGREKTVASAFSSANKASSSKSNPDITTTTPKPPLELSSDSSKLSAMASPVQSEHGRIMMPSSPSRNLSSSSPRLVSPAGSQIFERDVQDSTVTLPPTSPAIPSHIKTENHIPPVLDASSEAITDGHLDPDNVEIVTHASHQPAGLTVPGANSSGGNPSASDTWTDELASFAAAAAAATNSTERDDSASNYGSIDATDVRRLSFISFADVVLAEQTGHAGPATGSRDSVHVAGLTSMPSHRSPSPIRSPVSSQGAVGTSPPTSNPASIKGLDLSPSKQSMQSMQPMQPMQPIQPIGSPTSTHHSLAVGSNGELNVETMTQALRRTGSTDMSGLRSGPASPTEGPSR